MVDRGLFRHVVDTESAEAESVRERRIRDHRHLCRRAARRYVRAGIERSDLEQVGAIGLIKAADRYRDELGTPFEAFAWTFVLGELSHYVRDYEHVVRVPRRLGKLERTSCAALEHLGARLGREPSDSEVAAYLGVSTAALHAAKAARESRVPVSLLGCEGLELGPAFSAGLAERVDMERALARLAPIPRTVVLGLHVAGLKRCELAAHLGVSLRALARINDRALATLAKTMCEAA